MSGPDKPLFVVSTPLAMVSKVTLWESTWHRHILKQHPEMKGRQDDVKTVTADPTLILQNQGRVGLIFVNDSVKKMAGAPLAVIVNERRKIIVTAYYHSGLIPLPAGLTVVWQKP